MAVGEIHVGDVGLIFLVTVLDGSGPRDLSSSTLTRLTFRKPDLTTLTVPATLHAGGADGVLGYATAEGDLDQPGTWRIQALVEAGPVRAYSDIAKFTVHANLGG